MRRTLSTAFLAVILPVCFFWLCGCQAGELPNREETAAGFISDFAEAAASDDGQALAAYVGNTYQINARVSGLSPDGVISIRCSSTAKISVTVPLEEWKALQIGQVIALEGTVKRIDTDQLGGAEMVLEPAHVTGDIFEISGEVADVYHDLERDGQDYVIIWDNSVVKNRQINIYLPENHEVQKGDIITAQGSLFAPSNLGELGIAVFPDRNTDEVFIMYEPDTVQKEVEK